MGELINGRTPEEIKIGLRNMLETCADVRGCDDVLCREMCCPYDGDESCHETILMGALALIERLESERDAALAKVPKWISVEERLPEMHDDGSVDAVLVTDGFLIHMAYYVNGQWVFCESGEMKEPMFYCVTHWAPLPKAPEEEG